jgi:xanthine dehydrogenase YagR molybdenum-binding subunit
MPTTTQPSPGMRFITVPKVENGITTEVQIEVPDDTNGPTWGPNNKHRILNTKIPRADGPAKTTGTAVYTHDVRVPGMLFGRMLVSPHAHAKVTKIDLTAAQSIDGVKAVSAVSLPNNEVRFEGQPVAAVAAVTPELADDAVRAIVVQYDVLPHVVKADDAMKPDAPKVVPTAPPVQRQGNLDATTAALAKCDVVFDVEYRSVIMHHCCLETHSVVADYKGGESATVYCSTQNTFSIPRGAARELQIDQSNVVGIVHHMGGGFGSKFDPGFVGQWACRFAKQLSTPVKMVLTRREEFLAAGNGPGSVQTFKAGVNKDGTLVALIAHQHSLPGVGRQGVAAQPYQYKAEYVYREASPLQTNEDASVAMRAPGHPQACFAMESLMDELAEKISMDPIEFRKKNLGTNHPTNVPTWTRQLDIGAKAIGWENRKAVAGSDPGPLKRGFGCAIGAWGGGGSQGCVVTVTVGQDGSVSAVVGSQDLGTGTRTYLRAIVAEELGLNYEDVHEQIGDTRLGNASASGGSTTAASLSPAVKVAAFNTRLEIARRVAPLLGADPKDVAFADRKIVGNGKSLDWNQACQALPAAGLSIRGEWAPGMSGDGETGPAHGASFAEVEVDVETGHVRVIKMCHTQDGGLPLNRLAMESQINGGMIQSMGMALYEGRVMDADLGVMVNSGFGDYKLPGALEIPELIPIIDDGDDRQVVIGIAEPGNIPGAGAIANAVYNACGVRVRQLPITPDKILNGLNKA